MTILTEIFAHKRAEVAAQKERLPLMELMRQIESARPPLDFAAALERAPCPPALIAEVKKGSPSQGVMVTDFDPIRLARAYAENGAAAISVLTDEKYFGGSLEVLRQIAALDLRLPLLRKDFICDRYQIYESRANGADAILLIAAELSDGDLGAFQSLARDLGLAALVEAHTRGELGRALNCGATLIGINNRDLRDFTMSLDTARGLRPPIPPGVVVVVESGLKARSDFCDLQVDAALIGEAIVKASDIAGKVRELAGV
jgi:indole-3-glycerol phosphate synthase